MEKILSAYVWAWKNYKSVDVSLTNLRKFYKVQWLDDRFIGSLNDSRTPYANDLYKIIRGE